jgi:hypothetical protein
MQIARPIVEEGKVDKAKVHQAKIDEARVADRKVYDDVTPIRSVPSKFQYLKPFSEEWKQRQEEEARRVRAATTICRC